MLFEIPFPHPAIFADVVFRRVRWKSQIWKKIISLLAVGSAYFFKRRS